MAEQDTNGTYSNRWKFNGKELDNDTGLYYYEARYYDPSLSMWMSVDPLAEKFPGWSPYNYTLNNPINLVDPDGRAPCPPGVICDDPVLNPQISNDNGGKNNNRIGSSRGHKGTDILASKGRKIKTALGGTVTVINNHKSDEYTGYRRKGVRKSPTTGLGNTVIIETTLENDYTYTNSKGKEFTLKKGETLFMKYSHLDFGIEELDGQTIEAGTVIGEGGATGNAGLFKGIWGIDEEYWHVHIEARKGDQFGEVIDAEGFFKTKFDAEGNAIPNLPPPVDNSLEGNPKNN
jgi:RHS repeat-associated protein